MDRAKRDNKPFFAWVNATRMHIWTHLKPESEGKTGLGVVADGMTEHDGHVGQLLKKLDDLGIANNTIVVYTTDNGAEVITFGCSGLFFLRPFLQQRLKEIGWDVPVLEGYQCAITLAKSLVDLKVCASSLTFPPDRPKKWRKKKVF